MLSSLEPLEERFRQVEEESERRALQEQELSANELVDPDLVSLSRHGHQRKKSSVSVSRFGQPSTSIGPSSSTSPTPSLLAAVAHKSTFYHSLANPRSMDSFISEGSEDESRHLEDDQQVTQVERIHGRQPFQKTVEAILPRRMSRSHSSNVLSPNTRLIIDVSVEKATVDAAHARSEDIHTTTIHATKAGELHRRPSRTISALGAKPPANGLVERAKSFARKFGRKRKPESG
ncbi:hypothetical protein CY34DRAFT_619640 [Suillus luteus UH-Slu-Lm8-n1]|uniref:Unplaced genomic scaffold CY34scaffold_58, whole genome shotgun sequence n=1 Tax=Suillus luteus UH-Slu-Lm8-n1 TaxID=930992 RepID=A0A0D0AS75_9AGAM|nr:hypothetical protein CY34DRAFT_619640 [Suillus luteus UH-Slu-Lm8-n1]